MLSGIDPIARPGIVRLPNGGIESLVGVCEVPSDLRVRQNVVVPVLQVQNVPVAVVLLHHGPARIRLLRGEEDGCGGERGDQRRREKDLSASVHSITDSVRHGFPCTTGSMFAS